MNGLNSLDINDETDGVPWEQFYDEKTWENLDTKKAKAARKEEIDFMRK